MTCSAELSIKGNSNGSYTDSKNTVLKKEIKKGKAELQKSKLQEAVVSSRYLQQLQEIKDVVGEGFSFDKIDELLSESNENMSAVLEQVKSELQEPGVKLV